MPPSDTFILEVACAKASGVVNGKPDGNFHGLDTASRAQMSSIVGRGDDKAVDLQATGQTVNPLPAPGTNPFTDVGDPPPDGGTPTAPHTDNILRLNAAGIVQGKTATTFDPGGDETRFQLIKTVVGSEEFATGTTLDDTCGVTFADGAETDATFGEFVKKAGCAGIVQGKANGALDGSQPVNRYQTAAIEMRSLADMMDAGFITPLNGTAPLQQLAVNCTPSAPTAVTVSGTKGTATGDSAKVTCAIPDSDGSHLAVSLLPTNPVVINSPIGLLFLDKDVNSRVDCSGSPKDNVGGGVCVEPSNGFGPLHAYIQAINGVTQANETTQTVLDITPGSGGDITLDINDRTANEQWNLVVWKDMDTNGYLNAADVTGFPVGSAAEPFGLSGTVSVIPPEQTTGFNCASGLGVALVVPELDLFTSQPGPCGGAATFKYGATTPASQQAASSSNTYQYDSGTVGGPPPGFTISGAQFEDYNNAVNFPNATGLPVFGDTFNVFYNPPTSTFQYTDDVPKVVSGTGATVTDADNGGVADDITTNWTTVSNPDVTGYQVWRAIVASNGTPGAYHCVGGATAPFTQAPGTCPGPAIPKTGTSFNDLGVDSGNPDAPQPGTKYAYQIFAINTNGESGGNQTLPATATVPSATSTAVPFETGASMTPYTPPSVLTPGNPNLAVGDSFLFSFNTPTGTPLTLGATPTLTVGNAENQTFTFTGGSGGNASFNITGANQNQLVVTALGATAGSDMPGGFDLSNNNGSGNWAVAVVSSAGIGNANGDANWAKSGLPTTVGNCPPPPATDFNRTLFENFPAFPNGGGNYEGSYNDPGPCGGPGNNLPLQIPVGAITVNTTNGTVTIAAGQSGPSDIVTGDTVTLFNKVGATLGSGAYNNVSGLTITSSASFAPGDVLYVNYLDNSASSTWGGTTTTPNTGPSGIPSASTAGFNPSNAPVVCDGGLNTPCAPAPTGAGTAGNPLVVTWSVPATETGPAANYTVRDSTNSTLVATATSVTAPNASTNPAVCPSPPAVGTCAFKLVLDHALTPGTVYTLNVASGTVQHTGISNTPNAAQSVVFTATAADTTPPSVTGFTANEGDSSFTITFSEPVTGATASDFFVTGGNSVTGIAGGPSVYTLTTSAPLASGQSVGVSANSVSDAAGNLGPTTAFSGPVTNNSSPFSTNARLTTDSRSFQPLPSGTLTPATTGDSKLSASDVMRITFNEPMDTTSLPAAGDGINLSCGDTIGFPAGEATYAWLTPTDLQITINNPLSVCDGEQLPDTIASYPVGIKDLAGNPATTTPPVGTVDNTFDDPSGPYIISDTAAAGLLEFRITFNEPVNCTDAQNTAKYTATTNGATATTILSATCESSTVVRIDVGSALAAGATISTISIRDTATTANTASHNNYVLV